MKFYTYIIKSQTSGKLYIGQTADLEKRIDRHNAGGSQYTRGKGPWELVFSIQLPSRAEAMQMEKKLKGFKNKERIYDWIIRQKSSCG